MSDKLLGELIGSMVEEKIGDIFTTFFAKVISYDANAMRCTIQPLHKVNINGELEDVSIIEGCPISFVNTADFSIKIPLTKGCVVLVTCTMVAIDYVLVDENTKDAIIKDKYRINDAVVLSTVNTDKDSSHVKGNESDIVILSKSSGMSIVLGKNGDITVTGAKATSIQSQTVDVKAQSTTITAPMNTINGNLTLNGNLMATGTGAFAVSVSSPVASLGGSTMEGGVMTVPNNAIIGGISYVGHKHKYLDVYYNGQETRTTQNPE